MSPGAQHLPPAPAPALPSPARPAGLPAPAAGLLAPATRPVQRPADARLAVIDGRGPARHLPRAALPSLLRPGDLLVANDAATLPASLAGRHELTGAPVEVRLAARRSLDPRDARHYRAVVFGAGDHRTPTERRPPPPLLAPGDALSLGPLRARVQRLAGHPRLIDLRFEGDARGIWEGLARHGRPVQYAYMAEPLALWDVWTPLAGPPVAVEPPSAGFALDWAMLGQLRQRGVEVATLTHAAGLSSTGDPELDRRLPLDEPYFIPQPTAEAVARARRQGGRVVAVGTTVVRALESAAASDGAVAPGPGLATLKLGPGSPLHAVDALVSGTHDPGTSHHTLLGAFVDEATLAQADAALLAEGYRTHEFGDSVLVLRSRR